MNQVFLFKVCFISKFLQTRAKMPRCSMVQVRKGKQEINPTQKSSNFPNANNKNKHDYIIMLFLLLQDVTFHSKSNYTFAPLILLAN